MVFTYRSPELRDPESGWRVVDFIEFAAKTPEFLLVEDYDSFRLWFISLERIHDIRELDLDLVLGSRVTSDECERL